MKKVSADQTISKTDCYICQKQNGRGRKHMTKEGYEILKRMDITAAENQMALHCAPFIMGLKPSNLLMLQSSQTDDVQKLLRQAGTDCFLLYKGAVKSALLLYHGSWLKDYLNESDVCKILVQLGYRGLSFPDMLAVFAGRYQACMNGFREFPHEMGLFLGYPPKDVTGFIENRGENCIFAGYWKVYDRPLEKRRLFQKFDQAKEALLRLIAEVTLFPFFVKKY